MEGITGSLILALFAAGWLILVMWVCIISLRLRAIAKRDKVIATAAENEDFVAAVEKSLTELTALRNDLDSAKVAHAELSQLLEGAVQRVGVVRFDAFEDTGGKLSFSAALLNHYGDGVVISAINGRQESRCYAKTIRQGSSEHNLSDEEHQAIHQALNSTAASIV